MNGITKNSKELLEETERLQRENKILLQQLREARASIKAIKKGNIDALVIAEKNHLKIYTEQTADRIYRLLIEKMPEGAVTLTENGVILYCNSYFAKMMNLPLQKVIGVAFCNFIDDSSRTHCDTLIERGKINAEKDEVSLKTAEGKSISVLMAINALKVDSENVLSIIVSDLTVLNKNKEDIKSKSRQMEQKNLELKSAYEELMSQNEEKEKRSAQLFFANQELAFKSVEIEKRAYELKMQNKKLKEARKKINKLNENLETTVKERTRELEFSRQHFKFLTDNIPQMAWTADSDGTIDYYNARWYEYTGIPLTKTKSTGWNKILLPEDLRKVNALWKKSMESGKVYQQEFRIKCITDNEYRWHLCRALPFKDETGVIVKWFGTCTNIEEQKKAIEQKDEFIGLTSHELRTPITSLKAYIQLLERELTDKVNPEAFKYVLKSHKLVEKLNLLVTELHEVTKIQAGKLTLQKTKFNFEEFLESTIESIQISNATHQISRIGEVNVTIFADRHRLQQVLFNFLTNAIKYSPNNSNIIVEAKADKKTLTVSVKDFGLGIPKNELPQIFTRFFRASSTKNIEGLGLGLYLCQQIIKAHKGEVWIESEEGKGSTFYFSLPIVKSKQ